MLRIRFHHYAWFLLAYNLAVILGGAFVRATVSGDGCGSHWPHCHGQLLPPPGRLETLIEYGHRVSSGLLLLLAPVLVVWAYRLFPAGHRVRRAATGVGAMVVVEALIGAGLVLFRLVARDESVGRAVVMPLHLVATFVLLMSCALAAWWGSGRGGPLRLRGSGRLGAALAAAVGCTVLLGISGALTALGDTLFPAASLAEGFRQDLDPEHFLIAIRWVHPLIALITGFAVALAAALTMHTRPDEEVHRLARGAVMVYAAQLVAGFVNLGLLAPVWMQLIHLLLAETFWILLVLTCAAALREGVPVRAWPEETEAAPPAGRPAAAGAGAPTATWRDYLALTKPRVISLLLLTAVLAMPIAASVDGLPQPGLGLYLVVAVGFFMAAGAANAINMVLERDLDLRMGRTSGRPTLTDRMPPGNALRFAAALGTGSFLLLTWGANLLSALMALSGLAFYVVVYTLLLKRRTWTNIVIGGAAGAFPPLVGWAAVSGNLGAVAWCLFGIVFLWTPVHFWALAILLKDDYARAGVPMLPVVHGERATVAQIAGYAVLTVLLSALPFWLLGRNGQPAVGWFYLAAVGLLNLVLLGRSFQLYREPSPARARSLFKYSLVYLALLFLAMALDQAPWL